jgi:hypothetical protein
MLEPMSWRGFAGRIAAAVALFVLAVTVPAGDAMAGTFVSADGGFKYVFNSYKLGPGNTETLGAACPGRTRVLSGGVTSFGDINDAYISSSYPSDGGDPDSAPDDGWKSKVTSFDTYTTGSAHAVCARLNPTYRTRRYEVEAMVSATDETVGCPEDEAIVHGGFRGPTAVRPGSTFPIDNGSTDFWGLRVENVSDKERPVTGYAVCSAKLDVTYVAGSAPVGTNARVFIEPQCPGNAPNIVGGGPVGTGGFGDVRFSVNAPDPFQQPLSDEWVMQVENEGPPVNYTVWADCVANL